MADRRLVTLLVLLGAAALGQNACAGSTVTSGSQTPTAGAAGSGGSGPNTIPWPDAAGPGGTGQGGTGAGGTATGGTAAGGSATGGSGGGDSGTGGPCGGMQPKTCMDYSTCKSTQQCVASCPAAPAEICNLADDNCNGQCDEGANCRVGVYRSYNSSTGEHFYTTSSSEAACCGFTVEFANYYYLYKAPTTGLVAFYRCLLANGMHFYTTSANCEGAPGSTKESTLGYIGQGTACGAVPLYRLSSSNGDHLYTTSSSERQSAINGGYNDEGIAGYVWKGP